MHDEGDEDLTVIWSPMMTFVGEGNGSSGQVFMAKPGFAAKL